MVAIQVAITSAILCVVSTFAYKWQYKKQRPPLPPSPKGDPIIGHLRCMPTEYEEVAYKAWADELGSSVVSVNLLGQVIVVLNTAEDANELLVKRALHYSNRFQIPMMSSPRLTGWGKGSGLLNYGERWRGQRKVMHEVLQKKTLKMMWPAIVKQTRLLMQRVSDTHDFQSEIARMVGAVVLQSAYGYEITKAGDPMVEIARAGMKGFSDASMPADFLVNVFPWLEYVPSWFPGTGWKRKAIAWSKAREDLMNVPFEWTRQQMADGVAQPSALNSILTELANVQSEGDRTEEEDRIKWAIGSLYAGAIETTTSTILIFMLAMIHNPDIQAKAQQEVDAIVGDQRLPEMEDQDDLPYIGRVIKEVLRWRPVAPLGVPHACAKDDMYRGYFIPKEAVVIGNIWAMCSNPETYPNPDKFHPDRFIDPTTPDPPAFGFGRRICPGQDFAEALLFLTVATMLSVFDVRPAKDDLGNDVMPDTKLVGNSLVRRFPFPFQCTVELRSEAKRGLLSRG
ncbi:unnamed protein product [Rhizoctonia solani]|uniref:O-methylsterigmatocystin oxidoreductase n=1 Tax=Rhizoctonia solani TaxID=456999 RepID=A0A8H3ARZ9_9AGAM|nr:unnamed protein product [Rhizoctonia solani]